MKNLLLVFIGGGLGSSLRYLIGKSLNNHTTTFPWGTFIANLLGCLLIGIILGWSLQKAKLSESYVLLLATGFCGGFTTFSAFSNESLNLLKTGETITFGFYVLGSIVLGLGLVWLGYQLVKIN